MSTCLPSRVDIKQGIYLIGIKVQAPNPTIALQGYDSDAATWHQLFHIEDMIEQLFLDSVLVSVK